jgi:hypothetical protein
VFENKVLRRIFEPKREEVVGGWRRFYIELHNFHASSIIRLIKSRRMNRVCSTQGRDKNAYKSFA